MIPQALCPNRSSNSGLATSKSTIPTASSTTVFRCHLEVPWKGEPHHLIQPIGEIRDRKKDRISYRHMSNQVDLTQISYYDSAKKEHELEVEISPDEIEKQFALLRGEEGESI